MGDPGQDEAAAGQFRRAAALRGAAVGIVIDGRAVQVQEGQSVLAAVLASGHRLRRSEFTGAPRAGFCVMGFCQDCWIAEASDGRIRACTTPVRAGMVLDTGPQTEAAGA